MTNTSEFPRWDVFISYASEDRAAVAEPLAASLRSLGLRVWFDQYELKVGDSLRERIDEDLGQSSFGIVVLSPSFFEKHYPGRELHGLAQREVDGDNMILPVWYNVTDHDVRRFSALLADRIAARWEEGIETVVARLFAVVGKQAMEEARRIAERVKSLVEMSSGPALVQILDGAHAHSAVHDELLTQEEVDIVSSFLDGLGDSIDGLSFADGAGERARVGFAYTDELKQLRLAGWKVFAARAVQAELEGVRGKWEIGLVAVVRDTRTHVAYLDGQFLIGKGKAPEAAV